MNPDFAFPLLCGKVQYGSLEIRTGGSRFRYGERSPLRAGHGKHDISGKAVGRRPVIHCYAIGFAGSNRRFIFSAVKEHNSLVIRLGNLVRTVREFHHTPFSPLYGQAVPLFFRQQFGAAEHQ